MPSGTARFYSSMSLPGHGPREARPEDKLDPPSRDRSPLRRAKTRQSSFLADISWIAGSSPAMTVRMAAGARPRAYASSFPIHDVKQRCPLGRRSYGNMFRTSQGASAVRAGEASGSHHAADAPLGMGLMARAANDAGVFVIPLSRTIGGAGAVYQRCNQGDPRPGPGEWPGRGDRGRTLS
jgi:hypothetical protein